MGDIGGGIAGGCCAAICSVVAEAFQFQSTQCESRRGQKYRHESRIERKREGAEG